MKENLPGTDTARQELSAYFCLLADSFGLPRSDCSNLRDSFLGGDPLRVSEIIEDSGLSKGSVSTGLRFLEPIGFIHLFVESSDRQTFYRPELSMRRIAAGLIGDNFTPASKRGEMLLDGVGKDPELSDHLKTRLASLQS